MVHHKNSSPTSFIIPTQSQFDSRLRTLDNLKYNSRLAMAGFYRPNRPSYACQDYLTTFCCGLVTSASSLTGDDAMDPVAWHFGKSRARFENGCPYIMSLVKWEVEKMLNHINLEPRLLPDGEDFTHMKIIVDQM